MGGGRGDTHLKHNNRGKKKNSTSAKWYSAWENTKPQTKKFYIMSQWKNSFGILV